MKVKTAELIGPALTWAVATIEGYGGLRINPHAFDQSLIMNRWDGQCVLFSALNYPTDWAQGGPIIEREWLDITSWPNESDEGMRWQCHQYDAPKPYQALGPTPLIAAMRCFVASKLGDEVEIPEELLT